jgi:hypothetical protein
MTFREWIEALANSRGNSVSDYLDDPTYDYRQFYKRQPVEAMKILKKDKYAHFSDVGKTVYHPTFSDESDFSGYKNYHNPNGVTGGHWNPAGTRYTLSRSQLANGWNIPRTIDYAGLAENNGLEVRMPNGNMYQYPTGEYFAKILPEVEVVYKKNKQKQR